MDKKERRQKRARRTRARLAHQALHRLCVHRTPRHIYAQIFDPVTTKVVVTASTVQKELRSAVKYTGNKDAAAAVGRAIAERAKAKGVARVAFDRSGFKYHGRVKALADAAREAGLQI